MLMGRRHDGRDLLGRPREHDGERLSCGRASGAVTRIRPQILRIRDDVVVAQRGIARGEHGIVGGHGGTLARPLGGGRPPRTLGAPGSGARDRQGFLNLVSQVRILPGPPVPVVE